MDLSLDTEAAATSVLLSNRNDLTIGCLLERYSALGTALLAHVILLRKERRAPTSYVSPTRAQFPALSFKKASRKTGSFSLHTDTFEDDCTYRPLYHLN